MSSFQYICLNGGRQREAGVIDANNKAIAANILRERGLSVLELRDVDKKKGLDSSDILVILGKILPISTGQKIFLFRQLALMLRSGLSLTESLEIQKNLSKGHLYQVIDDINNQVRSGDTLSNAFAKHKNLFPSMAEHLIRSAEATGELDVVMARIAKHMERKQDISRQTITTMLYPGITMLIAIAMFYMLVSKVIPKFAEFFINAGKTLPPETQSMVDLANFFNDWGLVILGIMGAIAFCLSYYYTKPQGRLIIDSTLLKLPLIGSIITLSTMSQISMTLSMLLNSGLTLIEALQIIRGLVGNRLISNDLDKAREAILSGKDFGTSLKGSNVTPLLQSLVSVGEQSGSLVQVLDEAGNHYEEALKMKSKILSGLMEPISILIIGAMVGYVYIAFFKAIFALAG